MGYYWTQAATWFKGPTGNWFRERRGVTKAERFGGRAEYLLNQEFPQLLEHRHFVTKFLHELKEFVHDVERAGENCFRVLFNELSQDITELNEVDGILNDLGVYWSELPKYPQLREAEKMFLMSIVKTMKSDEVRERGEYKEVEAVMLEAEKYGRQDFMDALRTFFKKRGNLKNVWERISWKQSINASRASLADSRKLRYEIRALLREVSKVKGAKTTSQKQKLLAKLEADLKRASQDVAVMFKESYFVRERALLFFMRLLYVAERCHLYLSEEVRKSDAPEQSDTDLVRDMGEVLRKLGEHFHDFISQEFRIVINKIESDVKKADALLARA